MLKMSSRLFVLIRNVFAHVISSSFSLLSQLGLMVFLSSLSIHFFVSQLHFLAWCFSVSLVFKSYDSVCIHVLS